MTSSKLFTVEWKAVEQWVRQVAQEIAFDTIVGISRSGLPIAVALSALRPEAGLAILGRVGPRGPKPPLYDFAADRADRRAHLEQSLELGFLPETACRILIVDDVATFGDTLFVAAQKVRQSAPDAPIRFATYAADLMRLTASRPEIAQLLSYQITIDNAETWVTFPWNLYP